MPELNEFGGGSDSGYNGGYINGDGANGDPGCGDDYGNGHNSFLCGNGLGDGHIHRYIEKSEWEGVLCQN